MLGYFLLNISLKSDNCISINFSFLFVQKIKMEIQSYTLTNLYVYVIVTVFLTKVIYNSGKGRVQANLNKYLNT